MKKFVKPLNGLPTESKDNEVLSLGTLPAGTKISFAVHNIDDWAYDAMVMRWRVNRL